jgi:DNA modification methylase
MKKNGTGRIGEPNDPRSCILAHSNLRNLVTASTQMVAVKRLPTNTTTHGHAVHRWFNFIAGFSPELVQACVAARGVCATDDVRLLDPFSGCGTAPLAARLLGASAVAYEAHPFFAAISEAKANSARYWDSLPAIHAAIGRGLLRRDVTGVAISDSAAAFLGKMFDGENLVALHSARRELTEAGLAANPLALLILSRILDYCCFAATDGIYKAPTSTKRALSPKAAMTKVFGTLAEDELEAHIGRDTPRIYAKSSEAMEELEDNSIDLVVTSPPYLNNFDFAEMTRMYLYFWGMAATWGEISDRVRSRLIVNTTTALKGHKDRQEAYRSTLPVGVRDAADQAVASLAVRRTSKAGKKDYDLLVYPYLSQMQTVLRECRRVLRPGAPFHMMVSDAALYGIHLPAPQWLADIMTHAGFSDVQCEMVRPRGHRWILEKREGAVGGLGEYYIFGRSA